MKLFCFLLIVCLLLHGLSCIKQQQSINKCGTFRTLLNSWFDWSFLRFCPANSNNTNTFEDDFEFLYMDSPTDSLSDDETFQGLLNPLSPILNDFTNKNTKSEEKLEIIKEGHFLFKKQEHL